MILKPFELAYRGVTRAKRTAYRAGLLRPRKLPRPVISIGNLAFGGSGKTPAVIAIARFLREKNRRVTILTRGHGRRDLAPIEIVSSDDAERFGDEPVLISTALPDVDVVVGVDRYEAGSWYLRERDCEVFLLDDGFQHLALERDIDVVLVSRASLLREGYSALADADFILRRGAVDGLPSKPSFEADLVPVGVRYRAQSIPLEAAKAKRIYAFSGLADNEQFFDALRAEGMSVVGQHGFGDHHRYTLAEISDLRKTAREAGADLLLTTGKDAVKVRDPEIGVLEVEMRIDPAFYRALDQRIQW